VRPYKAVIDTNVLHAGLYSASGASHRILELVDTGRIVPYLSTTLVFEYEEILRRKRKQLALRLKDIEVVLNGLCARGDQRRIHFLWRPQLPDPKDDHILELAVACDAADIVTFNAKDFKGASSFGVRVVRPAQVLEELL
jgi:putative PIN family toxin of toxin-antitoxin system